ncbi:phosphopantetheine-binding protein [Paenibacillus sp. OK003]|uniref:phosphopantetheine-binding protein n=1 Tax=Paenibacillus sp. OK003 TaxID=1884380 RepID=UPI0008D5FCB8|nr:phosphopantetheine-binding protein [Paenibacillus sp. OK003]SEL62389.1 acyl carrier protein [Paenibacillus sp. OK003]
MTVDYEVEMDEIKQTIKQTLLIDRLKLEDITAEEITDDMILFGEELGLDSVEAFEVMVGMEEVYGVMVEDLPATELKIHLKNVQSIAELIMARKTKGTREQ